MAGAVSPRVVVGLEKNSDLQGLAMASKLVTEKGVVLCEETVTGGMGKGVAVAILGSGAAGAVDQSALGAAHVHGQPVQDGAAHVHPCVAPLHGHDSVAHVHCNTPNFG
ncbi:hypothetical protein ACOSQ4_008444 [Xanthoceras sorbifolium]